MRSLLVIQTLTALAASQSVSGSSSSDAVTDAVPTPDAIPLDFLRGVDPPTYSTATDGLSQVVSYATGSAVSAASAAVVETPLTVFPAVTTVAINAAGDSAAAAASTGTPTATSSPDKRSLGNSIVHKRNACDVQPTVSLASRFDNIPTDISYKDFKANTDISSAASNAPTPSGYFNAFRDLKAANNALMYLGYTTIGDYDTTACANLCTKQQGCKAFNIYFERDPSLEPGPDCPNPNPIINIKCSFWGAPLDASTANNDGQWRQDFQVGIAGSNAYTSKLLGGPLDGWTAPQNLGNAVMNAPLRDCAGTWTYMGYKLLQTGYDTNNCAAACDAQNKYNTDHPPATGVTPLCAAFGSYLLSVTWKDGTTQNLGQMCTFYTSNWDKQYAVNTVAYDDGIGANYTYSSSFFYSRDERQPVCKSDIAAIQSNPSALDFCSSYVGYTPSTTVISATATPAISTAYSTTTTTTTVTTSSGTTTVAATTAAKRGLARRYPVRVPNPAATPAVIATLGASARISVACSEVATGATTLTSIVATAPTPMTTQTVTQTATLTVTVPAATVTAMA